MCVALTLTISIALNISVHSALPYNYFLTFMYMNAFVSKGLGLCTGIQMSLSPLSETPGLQICVCVCVCVCVFVLVSVCVCVCVCVCSGQCE